MAKRLYPFESLGYYSALSFGIGYSLVMISMIVAFMEEIAVEPGVLVLWVREIWPWIYVVTGLTGIVSAIYLGYVVVEIANHAVEEGLSISAVTRAGRVYALVTLVFSVSATVEYVANLQPISIPLFGVVGSLLLLTGFTIFKSEARESRLMGAVVIFISIILLYFIGFSRPPHVLVPPPGNFSLVPPGGPLLSEPTLEGYALLIAAAGGVVYFLPMLEERFKRSLTTILLSAGIAIFSAGLTYSGFSSVLVVIDLASRLRSLLLLVLSYLLIGASGLLGLAAVVFRFLVHIQAPSHLEEVPPVAPKSLDAREVLVRLMLSGEYEVSLKSLGEKGVLERVNEFRALANRALELISSLKEMGVEVSEYARSIQAISARALASVSKIRESEELFASELTGAMNDLKGVLEALESLKSEAEKVKEHLAKLEELHREGKISDSAYEALKKEYERRMTSLAGRKE